MVHDGMTPPYIRKGDVIGCGIDLTVPVIHFFFNGVKVKGHFRNFNLDGMFFPVISCSARIRYFILLNYSLEAFLLDKPDSRKEFTVISETKKLIKQVCKIELLTVEQKK